MSFTLGIEVTRRCNFRCRHCFVDAGSVAVADPDRARLEALIQEAARSGVTRLGWSGGEPLLRRDLAALTEKAATLGLGVGVVTNGFLGTPKRLVELRNAGLRVVQVSLDGPDPERAARFRQGPKNAFARAIQAIEQSVKLGLTTYVCTLFAPETAGDASAMVALAQSLGATALRYATYLPVGRASGQPFEDDAWAQPEVGELLRIARSRARSRCPVMLDCPTGPVPGNPRFACTAGRAVAYVLADGSLYPCTALFYSAYRAGNVYQTPLGELMAQGRMFKVLRQMANREPGGACARCALASTCRGGCPGRVLAEHGHLGRRGPRLPMPGCLLRLHPNVQHGRKQRGKEEIIETQATV